MAMNPTRSSAWRARQGWIGLLLLAVCWPLNWTLPGMRTAYLFFPLWLGYILVVDALVLTRAGTFAVDPFPSGLCIAVCGVGAGVVAVRNSQLAHGQLGIPQFTHPHAV